MEIIDHSAVVRGLLCIFAKHVLEGIFDTLKELVFKRLVNQYIIARDADLATARRLILSELFNGEIKVCRCIDDHWALSTEFENARGKVLSSGLCNDLSDCGGTCEADQI